MPIYEYICEACEKTHDALQKISDAPLTTCPSCGVAALTKKVSAAGFRLSGSGWYETDFKFANKRNIADSGDRASSRTSGDPSCASGRCSNRN